MIINDLFDLGSKRKYYRIKVPHFLMTTILLFVVQVLSALQSFPDYKFHTLSPEGGLSSDGVSGIKQDKYGFIWVKTIDELYRFDGYTYKRYSTQLKKEIPNSYFNPYIPFVEDHSSDLFFSSMEGILRYHRKSDYFEELLIGSVWNIGIDIHDNIWVVNGYGINILI